MRASSKLMSIIMSDERIRKSYQSRYYGPVISPPTSASLRPAQIQTKASDRSHDEESDDRSSNDCCSIGDMVIFGRPCWWYRDALLDRCIGWNLSLEYVKSSHDPVVICRRRRRSNESRHVEETECGRPSIEDAGSEAKSRATTAKD